MENERSKAKPVAVRIVYSARKPVADKKNEVAPAVKPVQPQTIVPKIVPKQPAKQEEAKKVDPKEFIRPKEAKKVFNFAPLKTQLLSFVRKYRWMLTTSLAAIALVVIFVSFFVPRLFFRSNIQKFLPEDTLVFGALSVDPLNADVRHLALDLKGTNTNVDISRITNYMGLGSLKFPENSEIQKHISREVGFAVFNSEEGLSRVAILHMSNPKDAESLLEALSTDQNREQKDYKGFHIFTLRDKQDASKVFSYLYTKHYVFISTGSTAGFALADVIHKDAVSLASQEGYKRLASTSRSRALGRVFIDSSKIGQLQALFGFSTKLEWSSLLLDNGPAYVSFYEKKGTLAYDMNFKQKNESSNDFSKPTLTQALPKTTFASLEGRNFSEDWQNVETMLTNSEPLLAFYFSNMKKRLNDSFAFDLQNNFLKYFTKDYVVALDQDTSRSKNTGKPFQNVGLVLTANNTKQFSDALPDIENKVKQILSSQFQNQPVSVTDEEYAGLTLRVFSGDGMPVNIYYVVKGDSLYVSTAKSFFDNIQNPEQGSLGATDAFKKLTNIGGHGYHMVYANLASEVDEDLVPKDAESFSSGMLVRDAQKGDNAVITGFIHLKTAQ